MDDCIFCKIVNKQIPSNIVYENEKVVVFKDISPVAPVHVLIVPKEHVSGLNDITVENAGIIVDIHLAAKEAAQILEIEEKGYRLINNCGLEAGQTVFHIHYHLIGGMNLGPKII